MPLRATAPPAAGPRRPASPAPTPWASGRVPNESQSTRPPPRRRRPGRCVWCGSQSGMVGGRAQPKSSARARVRRPSGAPGAAANQMARCSGIHSRAPWPPSTGSSCWPTSPCCSGWPGGSSAAGRDTADDYFLAGRNLGWFVVGRLDLRLQHRLGTPGRAGRRRAPPAASRWPTTSCTPGACWCSAGCWCRSTCGRASTRCRSSSSGASRRRRAGCCR